MNDGEEYPSVMQRIFGRDTVISNISMMGWGLTQEIRAYNEYGLAYKPKIVLLQFCQNDPYDNLSSPVTEYANGGFIFKNTGDISSPKIQAVISRSLIQKSQLFNFIRLNVIIPIFGAINKESAPHDSGLKAGTDNGMKSNLTKGLQDTLPSLAEKRYAELIIPFAKQLSKQGIHLVMISVNGELAKYPFIERTVQDLNMKHYLHYVEVRPWFMGVADYSSPEGHVWGKKGHTIIAENLVGVLRENH
ncbi:MAG TPA: hypothetical protein VK141_01125 [Nitrosomonas sp.]|nr:hypothetical protein [Nitrosomonas sp.]